ncbi:ABC transporter ATP-binding protein [Pseudoduganella violaceinigra]|uniref:ABC transporter ATP-binding protein n=1 Tax=Pseudoduganella violaceinigra TaxID=246602 RepID=UPI00041DAE79|nr:ABC transporter ATP-binding protein [Pseudoduganella violaceinigra]
MSSEIAIKIENLSKCYQIYDQPHDRLKQSILPRLQRLAGAPAKQYFREFQAVHNVSFEVRKGETVGIIGRNGSGKSTLLQMICGTLNPSSGSIVTNGRIAALLELGSGFNPEFTGRENVYMNAAVLGLTHAETAARFADIEKFADIGDFIDQPVKTYSSGMMVRLAFAVIAHVDADILVVDEALAVGDAFFTQKCMRFLRSFMATGTVLFVSHDTGAVVNLCNKAVLLEHGSLTMLDTPKNVIEQYLAKLYESSQDIQGVAEVQVAAEAVRALPAEYRDMRADLINGSTLRNDIEVFKFKSDGEGGFGAGGAIINSVRLLDAEGAPLSWVVGGEDVVLEIRCATLHAMYQPIIGFQFKDRLGQVIFSDNTFLTYKFNAIEAAPGQQLAARFSFRMPVLPTGDYSISPAIAEGTQENHVQHHWLHDALIVRVHASSVCFGLVGLPMRDINIQVTSPANRAGEHTEQSL